MKWMDIPQKNDIFNHENRENNIINQNINNKWRKNKQQEKKSLNHSINLNYNNYNNGTTLKYTRSEDYSDNASNYNASFDFEDVRATNVSEKTK